MKTNNNTIKPLITAEEIDKRLDELAEKINSDYDGKRILGICILKGAAIFAMDLLRKLSVPVEFDFIQAASYGQNHNSSGRIEIKKDLSDSIEGKNVIVFDDIIDTGCTLHYVMKTLEEQNPASLKLCVLIDKPERRLYNINADYYAFNVPSGFLVGYGLDYAQQYRTLPYIGVCITGK